MANVLKQLAGETAIYGLSTILARIVNFVLVPVYTRVLTQADYGVVTELMSWIAVLQVVMVLGLETGCFRFANRPGVDVSRVYGSAFSAVFAASVAVLALAIAFAEPIASAFGFGEFAASSVGAGASSAVGAAASSYNKVIMYMGGILAMDAVTAILFARLRQEHKALRFALIKTLKIFTELGVNLYLFLCASKPLWIYNFVSATPDFTYVIFAIFISCLLCVLLLLPDFFTLSLRPDGKLMREMLLYSLPLMIAALPGVVNDLLDRILFRWFDTSSEQWRATLGVYQAAVKLSVIMNLFIQMFRYASEPFFFQRASDRNSKELYSKVMTLFVAFCCTVLLGVIFYIDVLELLLGRDFRSAIGVVPIMLLSYILLGMLFNVNMWYKLSGRTTMAIWITLAGLVVTALVNIIFMPRFSYWASAFGHLASYAVMLLVSVLLGNKYYRIDYDWKKICLIFALTAVFYALSLLTAGIGLMPLRLGVNTLLLLVYLGSLWFLALKRVVRAA